MEILKLNKKLDNKYASQLEYMGNNDLTSMELSDGNSCFIEDGNFYIVLNTKNNEKLEDEDFEVISEVCPNCGTEWEDVLAVLTCPCMDDSYIY